VSADVQPDFLTVEQAAVVIGIGRTVAYELARKAADTGEGPFPAIRFGKQIRIPRRKLEALSGGPITVGDNTNQQTDRTSTDEISTTDRTTNHEDTDPNINTDHTPTTNTVEDTNTDLQQQPLPFTE